jgi:hypothetical protein
MPNKLLVITEFRPKGPPSPTGWFHLPPFWAQLPKNKNQSDQFIRAAWYNIDLNTWHPEILDTPSCVEYTDAETFKIEFKIPSPRPIVMFDHDHPEYLERLEYCCDNNITVTVETITVNPYWEHVPPKP